MGIKVTVDEITNIQNSSGIPTINENAGKLADEFDKVVYRDGSNSLESDLDFDGNRILNLPAPLTSTEPLRKIDGDIILGEAEAARDVAITAGPYYDSVALGEAAVVTGQAFAVVSSGVVTWYRKGTPSTPIFSPTTSASLAANGGAGLVGFKRNLLGTIPRTLQSRAEDTFLLTEWATNDGSTDNSTGLAALITELIARNSASAGANYRIIVPAGEYQYATSPNFGAVQNVHWDCSPGTVFRHTGTGVAFLMDGGATGGGQYRIRITGEPTIKGNANSTYGIDLRACHHAYISANVRDVATAVMRTRFSVCSEFLIRSSGLAIGGQSPNPANGFIIDQRGAGEYTNSCLFRNCKIEQLPGIGIDVVNGTMNTFVGGTSEGNVAGNIRVRSNSAENTFLNMTCEFTSGIDFYVEGNRNMLIDCYSDKEILITGILNQVVGGLFNSITNSGIGTSFEGVGYNAAGTGSFNNSGTRVHKRGVRNLTTNLFDNDEFSLPRNVGLKDNSGDERLFFGDASTTYKSPGGQHIFKDTSGVDTVTLASTQILISNVKVLGERGAAVADATDAATAITQLNTLLSRLRTHGLIAS